MADELRFEEVEQLMALRSDQYEQRVIALFRSGRATKAQWLAMAQAILCVSQSSEGDMVASIDRAVLGEPSHDGWYHRPVE